MRKLLVVLPLVVVAFSACTKKEETAAPAAQQGQQRVVNLAIWSNNVAPELVDEFQKQTGVQVKISNYSSNEELLAKLQAGASGYDVAVPSDYMVFAMIQLKLLHELDVAQLPNGKQLDPKWMKKSYDAENKYSLPYNWGTTGIAVNRSLYKGKLEGWKDLFNNADLAGKLTLLDDSREALGAALKSLGFSLNSKDPAQIAKAKEVLMKVKPRVKAFTSEPMVPLVNGETAVAHAFMSDALQARRKSGGKIEYLIPVEGGTLYIDNLVIPAGAQHLKEAHEFINFLLSPKSTAATVKNIMVAPASQAAFALLPPELQKDPLLFPSDATLGRLEMMQDLGDALTQYDRAWTEIKAGQ